jgi:hypothetical protein
MTQMELPSEPEESGRPEQANAGIERLSPKSRELGIYRSDCRVGTRVL